MVEEKVELRCPYGPKALLAKVVQNGDQKSYVAGNLLELNCRDCAKKMREDDKGVARVLHRYNIVGEMVESVVERYETH